MSLILLIPFIPLIPLIPLSAALADRVRLRNWITRHFRMKIEGTGPSNSWPRGYRMKPAQKSSHMNAIFGPHWIGLEKIGALWFPIFPYFYFFLITFSIFDFLWSDPMAFSARRWPFNCGQPVPSWHGDDAIVIYWLSAQVGMMNCNNRLTVL